MEISFVWKGDPPKYPPAEVIQGGLEFALSRFPDPRGLRDLVSTVYLSQDALRLNVVGVGWSKDDLRLFTFRYTLGNSRVSSCDYYENPTEAQ